MISVERYSAAARTEWDAFVERSKNATFLHRRSYMDYHSARFADHSIVFRHKGKAAALLPAHAVGGVLNSHSGLTYGGLLLGTEATAGMVCDMFAALGAYLAGQGFGKVVYKPVPHIYHSVPAEEDLYAMFHVCGARLSARSVSSAALLPQVLGWRGNHLRGLKRAAGVVEVREGTPLGEFWPLLEANLHGKYGVRPVHTVGEITELQRSNPGRIRQYGAFIGGEIVAGTTIYDTGRVLHVQYVASNREGNDSGALKAIYHHVMGTAPARVAYIDFGTSTEDGGRTLNRSLALFKEGFGARAVAYDTYEWDV